MATNPHAMTSDDTVVGSIDSTESSTEYVIADISADGAWLSMQADDAPTLGASPVDRCARIGSVRRLI
ncbi:hypothetical protein HTZ84_17880 [Haloterrigena sp. SYSU A558-1]|uniref:Uncharacterized protein n=1 Tax=Haloterrigena gelatinilytica TaxID=2741724 RepID=A0ABX2LID6_9EURY|nr:hypothetical protein [Haloterrigena gelatinilytica]NUC74148.1 hypothetical protein [Haloterrigena gelatinilytica]